jgi:hypothetical protein
MKDDWQRVSHQKHCPVCKKPDWCMIRKDGAAAICARVYDGCKKDLGEAGYLHVFGNQSTPWFDRPRGVRQQRTEPKAIIPVDWLSVQTDLRSRALPILVKAHAEQLGVTPESLHALEIGLTTKGAWTFPMRSTDATIIGIRIRTEQGRKWAWPGSRNGLFFATTFNAECGDITDAPLLVCEGPTDTAALLGYGFDVIGRASCNTGIDDVRALSFGRTVCVMTDVDENGAGETWAKKLCEALWDRTYSVRMVFPIEGKDAREWINRRKPSREAVLCVMMAQSPYCRL